MALPLQVRNILIASVLLVAGTGVVYGYQIGSVYIANLELKSDLKDLSSLTGVRIGLVDPRTPDQIRERVIAKAAEDGIQLEPEQVNVERVGEGKDGYIYLSAAYDVRIDVFGYPWRIHFTAESPHG
jgi:hypothetical protein